MADRRGTAIWAGAFVALSAGAAPAADIAMIVGTAAAPSEDLALLGEALNARGYEVYDRQAASREDLAQALAEVAARLPEAERLILVFSGEVQAEGPRAWLLPEGYAGDGRIDAALAGVPLDLLLDLAAEAPGRAALVIGAQAGEADPEAGFLELAQGVGEPAVPQGVLLIAGPEAQAVEAAISGLLVGESGVAEALATLPEGVATYGFVSPEAAFVGEAVAPEPEPRAAPEPEPAAAPEDLDARAEAALELGADARRAIQEQLTVLGYGTRGIDGVFGPGTRAAIADWQDDRALEGTGYVTSEQLRLLGAQADARRVELAAEAERARVAEEAADAEFWGATGANGSATDLRAYLERYPDGIYAAEARAALTREEEAVQEAAAADDRAAFLAARDADAVAAYDAYLQAYPDGAFAERAAARIEALERAPERARAEEAAQEQEDGLGLAEGSRVLIETQLAALGYEVGATDGDFDGDARRAVREFQTRQGLEVTGYVDQGTVQALLVASFGLLQ